VISKEDYKTSYNVRLTDRYIMTTEEIRAVCSGIQIYFSVT